MWMLSRAKGKCCFSMYLCMRNIHIFLIDFYNHHQHYQDRYYQYNILVLNKVLSTTTNTCERKEVLKSCLYMICAVAKWTNNEERVVYRFLSVFLFLFFFCSFFLQIAVTKTREWRLNMVTLDAFSFSIPNDR